MTTQQQQEQTDDEPGYHLKLEVLPEGTLIQRPFLGLQGQPFILVELTTGDDGAVTFAATAGGGLQDPQMIGEMLEMIGEGIQEAGPDSLVFTDSEGTELGTLADFDNEG